MPKNTANWGFLISGNESLRRHFKKQNPHRGEETDGRFNFQNAHITNFLIKKIKLSVILDTYLFGIHQVSQTKKNLNLKMHRAPFGRGVPEITGSQPLRSGIFCCQEGLGINYFRSVWLTTIHGYHGKKTTQSCHPIIPRQL